MAKKKTPTGPRADKNEDRFVAEYLACGECGVTAYMRTFPKATYDGARTNAAKLLARANVKAKLKQAKRRLRDKTGLRAERLVDELVKIAFSDIGDVFDFGGPVPALRPGPAIPIRARQAISSIEVTTLPARGRGKPGVRAKVRMYDKQKAIERIGSMLGLWDSPSDLEKFLASCPPRLAAELRRAAAEELHRRHAGETGGPAPAALLAAPGGGAGVPGGGADAGPVAGEVPGGRPPAATGDGLSPGGEDERLGGEDLAPLFDDG